MKDRESDGKPAREAAREAARIPAPTAAGPAPAWTGTLVDALGNRGLLRLASSRAIQRKCSCDGSTSGPCTTCAQPVARSAAGSSGNPATGSVDRVIASTGQPLDAGVRAAFEPRFGHDLGDVRVHTGADATASAREVQAHAYTVGSHVVFDEGRYQPHSTQGQRLLAHELTHVVQQRGGATHAAASRGVSQPDDPAEREADRIADTVVRGDVTHGVASIGHAEPDLTYRAPNPASCGIESRSFFDPDLVAIDKRGEIEHMLVQMDFMMTPGREPRAEFSIPGASKNPVKTGHTGFADLVDKKSLEVFEIKPDPNWMDAQAQAAHYAAHATAKCGGVWKPGASYKPNRNPIIRFGTAQWYVQLVAKFAQSGAILYEWEISNFPNAWSRKTIESWARFYVMQQLFGRTDNPPNWGVDPNPVFDPIYAATGAVAVTASAFNAVFSGEAAFIKAVAADVAANLGKVMGSERVLVSIPLEAWEVAFAASAVGKAAMQGTIGNLQVKMDPTVQLYRDTLGVIFAGMAAGYAVGIAGALAFAYGAPALAAIGAAATKALSATGAAINSTIGSAVAAWGKAAATAGAAAGVALAWMQPAMAAGGSATLQTGKVEYHKVPAFNREDKLPTELPGGGNTKRRVIGVLRAL